MASLLDRAASPALPAALGFSIIHQKVDLDFDLAAKRLRGHTEILINPSTSDFRFIRLKCRQCSLLKITVNGKLVSGIKYDDPYAKSHLQWRADVHQFHILQERLANIFAEISEEELVITLPKSVRLQHARGTVEAESRRASAFAASVEPGATQRTSGEALQFNPLTVVIEYEIRNIRDGFQTVGFAEGDLRYPHAYTLNSSTRGAHCPLFPWLEDIGSRNTWEISISCAKTIGSALKLAQTERPQHGSAKTESQGPSPSLSPEDEALELHVICTGEMTNEIDVPQDTTRKTTSFTCSSPVSARHISFAIGPFERADLSQFREDQEDHMGQKPIPVHGFHLPGRSADVLNTCLPVSRALDFFAMTYGSYPFSTYKLCFVDDAPEEILPTGWLSICSNRILFPESILEPIFQVTRQLIHALAFQWIGIDILPRQPEDAWVTIGIAFYMADIFMRELCGNNEYRFNQRQAADKVVDLDVGRASLADLGLFSDLEASEKELLELKAPLVLFILDQRMLKAGSLGFVRIVSKIFLNARIGDIMDNAIDTAYFKRICEKSGHEKLASFWDQWVHGAGCPRFNVQQRYNKKKLAIELIFQQVQEKMSTDREIQAANLLRDVREEMDEYPPGPLQPCFTGPITIRVHESNGAPYEHIIEIREAVQREEIPYSMKNKKSRKGKKTGSKSASGALPEVVTEAHDDTVLYSLGNVLQTEQDIKAWSFSEGNIEEEESTSQEGYEWIRLDVNFEWICKIQLQMPIQMWTSQLQQDSDVVAQCESVQYMQQQNPSLSISTILTRTLLDSRYFHGIRTLAAHGLAKMAAEEVDWIGLDHLEKAFSSMFCYDGSSMTKPNDFSDRARYIVQCAIVDAVGSVRDVGKRAPYRTRAWLYEKLRFNDNSSNSYSDCHYICRLMRALASCIATRPAPKHEETMSFDRDEGEDDIEFHEKCLEEIDRQRRIDEWILSYQNVISQCALHCKQILNQSGVISINPVDYLQYTSDQTSDELRTVAFGALFSLGLAKQETILRWFLYTLATEPSPFVRDAMIGVLEKTFGSFAVGDFSDDARLSNPHDDDGGLIIEQEASTEVRRAIFARRHTIVGALDALQRELGSNETLKQGLWSAIESSSLSLAQVWRLLDLCDKLYPPINSMHLVLKLPRYWRCKRTGKGKVIFYPSDRVRTRPIPRKLPTLKLKLHAGGASGASSPLATGRPTPITAKSHTSAYPFIKSEISSSGAQTSSHPSTPYSSTIGRPFFKPPKPPAAHASIPSRQSSQPARSPSVSAQHDSDAMVTDKGKPMLKIKLKVKKGGLGNSTPGTPGH